MKRSGPSSRTTSKKQVGKGWSQKEDAYNASAKKGGRLEILPDHA